MERPTQYPEFASDVGIALITEPPASSGTPTVVTKARGWVPGNPELDYMNWIHVRTFSWTAWLDQTTHRTIDLHPNHALPGGTLPSLGAGLAILAGEFSARVYADGVAVCDGLGSLVAAGPDANYTYTALRDTYWDLSRAGVWTPVAVANGAGEPAVTANSTRVYMVVTDGTDRTARTDYRKGRVQLATHDVVGNQRCALPGTIGPVPLGTTDAERRTAKRTITTDALSGATYELVETLETNTGTVIARRYVRHSSGAVEDVWVWGAELQVTSGVMTWIARATTAQRLVIGRAISRFAEKTGLTADVTTFNDSEWEAQTSANLVRPRRRQTFGQRYEVDVNAGVSGANANLVAHREDVRGDARYTLVESDETLPGTNGGERVYLTATSAILGGSGSTRTARVFAYNCFWNDGTTLWNRDLAGDAFIIVFGLTGFYVLRHDASLGATWSDAIGGADWEETFFAGRPGSITGSRCRAQKFIPQEASESGASIDSHALYQNNVPKGWGVATTDGANNITLQAGFGCSVAIGGGGTSLIVTSDKPFTTQYWALSFGVCGTGFPVFSAATTTTKTVQIYDSTGTPINLNTTPMRIEFSFDGIHA